MKKVKMRSRFKKFYDVSAWLGTEEIKRNTKGLKDMLKSLFTISVPTHKETYEEAVQRLNLTQQDLSHRKKQFFQAAMVYFILFLLLLFYAIYLYVHSKFLACFSASMVSLLVLSFFFREHFWYTQMKHRRLGMTFAQWILCIFK